MNEITITTKHGSELSETHVKETFDILQKIDGYFMNMKQSFFDIGKGMIELKEHFEGNVEHNYKVDETYVMGVEFTWILILEKAFNLKKSAIYNYINLYQRFANRPEFENYGLSQLTELSTLKEEQVQEVVDTQLITPETRIKDIREIKKKYKIDDQINDVKETGEIKEKPKKTQAAAESIDDDQRQVEEYEVEHQQKKAESDEKAKKLLNERYITLMNMMISFTNILEDRYKQIAYEVKENPKSMIPRGELKAYKTLYSELSLIAANAENDYIGFMQYYDIQQLNSRSFKRFDIDNWEPRQLNGE